MGIFCSNNKTRFIFVTGGVVSSLGKGVASASLGALLESRGLSVTILKLDPYIILDPGTMSPFQHGEVFVTEDGSETDLDLGHYERFIKSKMSKDNNFTTWKISLIPLGGYVKIMGLESIFKTSKDIDNSYDSFHRVSLIKKIFILLAGSGFNITFAWLTLFCVLFSSISHKVQYNTEEIRFSTLSQNAYQHAGFVISGKRDNFSNFKHFF